MRIIIYITLFFFNITILASEINLVNNYLSNIYPATLVFTQKDSEGKTQYGELVIEHPNRFRVNYYPPTPIVIIGTKNYISIYDYELDTSSRIASEDSLFRFFLDKNTSLESVFKILSLESLSNKILLSLYDTYSGNKIYLNFVKLQDKDIILSKIIIEETSGNLIEIAISNVTKINNISNKLFRIHSNPLQLDNVEIKKYYSLR